MSEQVVCPFWELSHGEPSVAEYTATAILPNRSAAVAARENVDWKCILLDLKTVVGPRKLLFLLDATIVERSSKAVVIPG